MLTVNFISKIFDLDKNRERRRKKKMKDTIDSFQSCWAGKFQFSRLVWNGGHDGPSIPYWKLSTWPEHKQGRDRASSNKNNQYVDCCQGYDPRFAKHETRPPLVDRAPLDGSCTIKSK